MLLERLIVSQKGVAIRDVVFKQGLNLIVDETSKSSTDSGNDVGKTTFLRVIDYCLGSDGNAIYTDPEFGTENEKILKFLENSAVTFQLTIKTSGTPIVIERAFGKVPKINGHEFTRKDLADFHSELGKLLFNLRDGKPTLRQIIKKFVRIETHEVSNTLNFLHPKVADSSYEPVFLFLFGFQDQEVLTTRSNAIVWLKRLEKQRKALASFPKGSLKQMLVVLDRDIAELEKQQDTFEVAESVKGEISDLERLRQRISTLTINLSKQRTRLQHSQKTVQSLQESKARIDPEQVKSIYDQAKVVIPTLQRSFEETLAFHESMIANKIKFVRSSIKPLEEQIAADDTELNELLVHESEVLRSLSKLGALADYQKISNNLTKKVEERGTKTAILKEIESVDAEIQETEKTLSDINQKIAVFIDDLTKRISQFNLIFSDFSRRLYEEEFIFSADTERSEVIESFEFRIDNVDSNVGTGKKKGQIAAFDLAYLKFLDEVKSRFPKFTLHDKLEDIHGNQIKTLFEIANSLSGQYIVAVLKDKLDGMDANWIKANTILTLSESEKFFRLI